MKADTICITYRAKSTKATIYKGIALWHIRERAGVFVHQITLSTN